VDIFQWNCGQFGLVIAAVHQLFWFALARNSSTRGLKRDAELPRYCCGTLFFFMIAVHLVISSFK
jgi:hypothetical protein